MTVTITPKAGHSPTPTQAPPSLGFSPWHNEGERLALCGPWVPQTPGHGWLARHGLLGYSVGQTDQVCVTTTWHHPTWYNVLAQVGPAVGVKSWPTPAHQWGVGFVNDIALGGAGYALQVFGGPTISADYLLPPEHYTILPDSGVAPDRLPLGKARTTCTMTAADGKLWVDWQGETVLAGIPRPDWTVGVDCWGVHLIDLHPLIGAPSWDWNTKDWTGPPVTHVEQGVTVDLEIHAW